jgi:hypothetical protein
VIAHPPAKMLNFKVAIIFMLVQLTMANMPGCESEPYHDETYHPVTRLISAVSMDPMAQEGIKKNFKTYTSKFDKVTKDSYKKNNLARRNGGGNNRNLRLLENCFDDICQGKTCSWCW